MAKLSTYEKIIGVLIFSLCLFTPTVIVYFNLNHNISAFVAILFIIIVMITGLYFKYNESKKTEKKLEKAKEINKLCNDIQYEAKELNHKMKNPDWAKYKH